MENAPDPPQASNDSASFGRLAIDPSRAKAVADWVMGSVGSYYGTMENAVHGGPLYPRDALALGPGTMLPVFGKAPGLGALGGKGAGPAGMSIKKWAETLRREGYTNEEIADTLTRYYSQPNVHISPRDVAEDLGVTKGAAAEAEKVPRPKTGGQPINPLKEPAMAELAKRDQPLLGVEPRFRELQQALRQKFPDVPNHIINNWILEFQGKGKWAGREPIKTAPGPASIKPPQAARAEGTGETISKDPNQLTWEDVLEPKK